MRRGNKVVNSWTNYLLGTDLRMYQNIYVWDTQYNSGYYLVLGFSRGDQRGSMCVTFGASAASPFNFRRT